MSKANYVCNPKTLQVRRSPTTPGWPWRTRNPGVSTSPAPRYGQQLACTEILPRIAG